MYYLGVAIATPDKYLSFILFNSQYQATLKTAMLRTSPSIH